MKVLLMEDEPDLNQSLVKLLKTQSYSVDSAFDGEEGLAYLAVADYDVIILDVMMPKLDGFAVVERLRRSGSKTPVLMLTAKDALEDKIKGLDLGADDYLVKPFEFAELLARLRAMLRRDNREVLTNRITFGQVSLDLAGRQVIKGDQLIDLTAKEYEILEFLARNANVVMSRETIREHVWDYDYEGDSNVIDVLIKNIRRKLGETSTQSIIQTKRGQGYVVQG